MDLRFTRVRTDDSGATSIEYALIASLISTVIVGAATVIGIALDIPFAAVAGALN